MSTDTAVRLFRVIVEFFNIIDIIIDETNEPELSNQRAKAKK